MEYVSRDSTKRELLSWLRGSTKNEVVAVCILVNKIADAEVPVYGAKEELVSGLWDAEREDIWSAIEAIFPDADCDEEESDSDSDEEVEPESDDEEDPSDEEE